MRLHLDYCDIIFHVPSSTNGSPNSLMEKIEKTQYQAGLAITGAWQGSNRNKLSETVGWESLSGRRFTRRVLHLFQIRTNLTAVYLNDKLPPLRTPTPRNTNSQIYRDIRSKTHRFKTSFSPNAKVSWNNVIINCHGNITFRKLKIHLLCFMRPKYKSVFNIYDPKGIKYLFQLRMNLSRLRSPKKHHNFVDNPLDICACNQGIEDTRHFLFECLKFASVIL